MGWRQLGLLTELYWGLPLRSYSRTRGWSDEQFDTAHQSLAGRGLITGDGAFTSEGRALRERIEELTDDQVRPVMAALGDDAGELIALLAAWGRSIRRASGYLSSGPHDLAERGQTLPDR